MRKKRSLDWPVIPGWRRKWQAAKLIAACGSMWMDFAEPASLCQNLNLSRLLLNCSISNLRCHRSTKRSNKMAMPRLTSFKASKPNTRETSCNLALNNTKTSACQKRKTIFAIQAQMMIQKHSATCQYWSSTCKRRNWPRIQRWICPIFCSTRTTKLSKKCRLTASYGHCQNQQ